MADTIVGTDEGDLKWKLLMESWLKETIALIEDWQTHKEQLNVKLQSLINESEELDKNIAGAQALVIAYRNKSVR